MSEQNKTDPADDFFAVTTGGAVNSDVADIDLSDVDENAIFPLVPQGVHDARLFETSNNPSKEGKKMITWTFEITTGDHAGQNLRAYTVLEGKEGSKWREQLKRMIVRLSPQTDMRAFNPVTTPRSMIGSPCRLVVGHHSWQGTMRAGIKEVLSPVVNKLFDDNDDVPF